MERMYLTRVFPVILFITILTCLSGCNRPSPEDPPRELTIWAHAGQQQERKTLSRQVNRFHRRHPDIKVSLTFIPERTYNSQVQAAALGGSLPDILECDGPYLANYVWQGHLTPLEKLLPRELVSDLLPSIIAQGTIRGRLYAVGTFDSGLGIYARRSELSRAGVRIPAGIGDAWRAQELDQALAALAVHDPDGAVLDLKLNYPGEWFTYAFAPQLVSAGADLVSGRNGLKATGVLDSTRSVAVLRQMQRWFERGYVDANVDDSAFVSGRVPLSWAGHWEYQRYRKACGKDLVLLPLPDWGTGSRTGQGSWCWCITQRSKSRDNAAAFLSFLMEPDEVLVMCAANAAVPATQTAINRSPLYGPGGPLSLFVEQLRHSAVPRPRTPAYPMITSAFQEAFHAVRTGADVQASLSRAARLIDEDIRDNAGYQPVADRK